MAGDDSRRSARARPAFAQSEVGRGAAFGDVDNDGDVDVLIGNNNGPTRLLLNQTAEGRHWMGLKLVGIGGRDMLGARVEIVRKGTSRWRRARSDGSYASANDPRVIVGLGESPNRQKSGLPGLMERSIPGRRWP